VQISKRIPRWIVARLRCGLNREFERKFEKFCVGLRNVNLYMREWIVRSCIQAGFKPPYDPCTCILRFLMCLFGIVKDFAEESQYCAPRSSALRNDRTHVVLDVMTLSSARKGETADIVPRAPSRACPHSILIWKLQYLVVTFRRHQASSE
jgi:hypothetical protein